MLHSDLQGLNYHLVDMHTKYPKIVEDIEFPKVHYNLGGMHNLMPKI
jgi:hypothetical protein